MKRGITGFLFGLTLLMSSCDTTTDVVENIFDYDPNEIRLSITHPSQTKVTDTNFELNDQIGVYMTVEGSTLQFSGNELNNEEFYYDSNSWVSARRLYWNEGSHDIYAYYPYCEAISDTEEYKFVLQSDQSTSATDEAMGGYEASDFLWGAASGVSASTDAVAITFSHRMSKVVVELVKGDEYEGEFSDDTEVYIHNTVTTASINLATGDVGKDIYASAQSIKAKSITTSQYTACIVPQSITSRVPLVEVVMGNISYLMEGTLSFKQGYQHTITVTISKSPEQTQIEIGGGISGWD